MKEDAGEGVGVGLPVVRPAMGSCFRGEGWAMTEAAARRMRVEMDFMLGGGLGSVVVG